MPNIVLTDEELQEVDRLLAEFDPERDPTTAPLLKHLNDEARVTLCTWIREAQRAALEVAIPMRAVIERAEAGGVVPAQREARPTATMEDGWMGLLTTFDEIHPLGPRVNEIMATLGEEGWVPFCGLCVTPAATFADMDRLYGRPARAS